MFLPRNRCPGQSTCLDKIHSRIWSECAGFWGFASFGTRIIQRCGTLLIMQRSQEEHHWEKAYTRAKYSKLTFIFQHACVAVCFARLLYSSCSEDSSCVMREGSARAGAIRCTDVKCQPPVLTFTSSPSFLVSILLYITCLQHFYSIHCTLPQCL